MFRFTLYLTNHEPISIFTEDEDYRNDIKLWYRKDIEQGNCIIEELDDEICIKYVDSHVPHSNSY